jgi:hypothetical protein
MIESWVPQVPRIWGPGKLPNHQHEVLDALFHLTGAINLPSNHQFSFEPADGRSQSAASTNPPPAESSPGPGCSYYDSIGFQG